MSVKPLKSKIQFFIQTYLSEQMKNRKYSPVLLMSILLIVSISINSSSGFASDKIVPSLQGKRENSDRSDFYNEYSSLIKALKENGLDVPNSFKKNVLKYLSSKKGSALIDAPPSKEGLSWHFYNVVFLRMDLIYVSYEDGEMFGGDLLVKVTYEKNKVTSMKTLWDSAG